MSIRLDPFAGSVRICRIDFDHMASAIFVLSNDNTGSGPTIGVEDNPSQRARREDNRFDEFFWKGCAVLVFRAVRRNYQCIPYGSTAHQVRIS